MEIGNPAPGQAAKLKVSADVQMQDGDFPVLFHDMPKYGSIFFITKMGFLYMYEVSTASLLYRQQFTDQLCFVNARNPNTDGMLVINKAGQIFMVNVEDSSLV
jgi:clathrin heavy chain